MANQDVHRSDSGATNGAGAGQGPEFVIQRIYLKDSSFEAPKTPEIFKSEWNPQLNMNLHTETNALGDDFHEVVLTVTVTVTMRDKEQTTAFLAEVKQAGIFTLKGFPDEQLRPMLGSFCPNILYPYARECISSLVSRGGFPQLYLTPVNFDALYQQHEAQQAQKGEAPTTAAADKS